MRKVMKKTIGQIIKIAYSFIYKVIPIDDKTILFISFHGKGYSDNPKAIFEEMSKDPRFSNYHFVWAIKRYKQKNIYIPNAKIVEYLSLPYFYYLSKARIWIFNCKMPEYIQKKKKQIYLQTWHGTPLKRLGHDIQVSNDTTFYRSKMSIDDMYRSYDVDVARYNYMISPNPFCTKVFQSAFGIDKDRLIETGYPRNDVLSNIDPEELQTIKQRLGIPLDKKVILYAPTWRDNQYVAKGYTFKLEADFRKWKHYLEKDYIIIFKPHYLIINKTENDPALKDFVFSIDANQDISSLYLISDVLITDYSSVFYDYAILQRPIYFYMFDLDNYKDELRGFYIDIYKELPGKIYEKEDYMLEDIANNIFDFEKLKKFNIYFNVHEDGNASKRVLNILCKERQL